MCLCRSPCLILPVGHNWTASPAAQSALSSYEFYLREALCGEWITEVKCLKTQLDFHSSWEVINIWISCCWELISFSSGQVIFCVPATVFVSSIRLLQWIWQVCCSMWRTLCRVSLCSRLGHILLILNHQQVQWCLVPVVYRLWNSHLYATSLKELTSCLWNCTSLGTIKHESREWDPHGKIEGIDFWLPRGRKIFSPPLCAQECWGPWYDAALVKIDMGLSFMCGHVRKMCLANEF